MIYSLPFSIYSIFPLEPNQGSLDHRKTETSCLLLLVVCGLAGQWVFVIAMG